MNLRELLGESHDGFAVAQGAATDGKYIYYMLSSSSNQNGRVLKVNASDHSVVLRGERINTHHANGMTYDSKRHRLVAIAYGDYKHQITYINPDTLKIQAPDGKTVGQPEVDYSNNIKIKDNKNRDVSYAAQKNGLAAIAYVEKYDVYLARSRGESESGASSFTNNDIWVFDAETLKAIGHVCVTITGRYPGTYQSMDADEKYVYYLLSDGGSKQPNNIILALDWNSEKLLPVKNGEKKVDESGKEVPITYIEEAWYANNNGSGKEDAVITLNTPYEVEGLTHITDKSGKEHFYVSEHHGHWAYTTKRVKEKYKVKWKKVKKKVKWKRVKRKGKWRWKYKKKKVWKYKTKYRYVNKKVKSYWMRDEYVYDLGVI